MRRPLKGDENKDGYLSKQEATDSIRGNKYKGNAGSKAAAAENRDRSRRGGPADVESRQYTPPKTSGSRGGARSKKRSKSSGSLGGKDKNSDGQIQMSEYSSTWDEETLQKFRKTDTDEDGIISADEWAKRSK